MINVKRKAVNSTMENKAMYLIPPKGMKMNPNQTHAYKIMDKLELNSGYCPCLPQKTVDTICPCKFARKVQACRCGLYMKSEEE